MKCWYSYGYGSYGCFVALYVAVFVVLKVKLKL